MVTKAPVPETTKAPAHPKTVEAPAEFSPLDEFIEHQRRAVDEAGKALLSLLPEGVQTHSEAAIKESVEGYRKLVNSTLDDVIERLKNAKIEPTKHSSVKRSETSK